MDDIGGKAIGILMDCDFQGLLLLLLDLGNLEISLQSLCLKYLSSNKQHYTQTTLENLPQALQKGLDVAEDVTILSQLGVGKWAGDRLSLSGDETDFSRFPPHGEWKKGRVFEMVSDDFSCTCAPKIDLHYFNKLQNLCTDKVVNLDKKEFLDPLAYDSEKKTVLDYAESRHGVMAGLIISLIFSTYKNSGDLIKAVTSQGMWTGDRITICPPDQLNDFESYRDVSNASDAKLALHDDSYVQCCIM